MALSKIDPAGLDIGQIGGRRNLIINGAMQVAQRGTSNTGVTSASHRIADQFFNSISSLGTWDLTQESDGPSGFGKSIKFDCTTADASPSASDFIILQHRMEAQNVSLLDYGSSDAKTFTLSFYVKSNKTGSGSVEFMQSDNSDKHYTTSYTINSANTWERKTITVAGDTSGVINDDNGRGFEIVWWLNSGSTFTSGSLSNAWQTQDNADRNASNLGIGGATSDYFQITGIQLEVGTVATPFEHRSFGEELALCQRYFQIMCSKGTNFHALAMVNLTATDRSDSIHLPQEMRANFSATIVGDPVNTNGGATSADKWALYYAGNWQGCSLMAVGERSTTSFRLDAVANNSNGSGGASGLYGGTGCYIECDAEL